MQKILLDIFKTINGYLTDYLLIVLLVAIGIYFTVRTRFVQIRCFGEGFKQVFGNFKIKGKKEKGGMSSFQAAATAIAAQVGTGNIVGACGAIFVGGPGAIFWMWVIAFLGMATNYAEAVIAQKTRVVNEDGSIDGGPVYYIKNAFRGKFGKFLAGFFAVAAMLALGFMGAMVQSNAIASNFSNAIAQFASEGSKDTVILVTNIIVGILVSVTAAFILIGGVQRLASVTEKIVPIMAIFYLVGGLFVLGINITSVPAAFGMIFKYAFVPNALIGGAVGAAIRKAISMGAKRGLFSNEAGMGSTPHAHALANVETPHKQGTAAIVSVFIDTFLVLTMTALVVISTLYAAPTAPLTSDFYASEAAASFSSATMAQAAFSSSFAVIFGAKAGSIIGSFFVSICLLFFAFSTIIGWNYFGKVNFQHLFGKKATIVYTIIAVAFIFLGSMLSNDLVWELTDFFNYLMVIPNVIALFALTKLVTDSAKSDKLPKVKGEATPEE